MKLTDRIYLVGSGAQGVGMSDDYDCHIYLIDGGGELALVDAGGGLDTERIVENIRSDGLDPAKVEHLLLTHAHGDHAGGATGLRGALGEPRVYIHSEWAEVMRTGDEEAISLNEAKRVGLYPEDYRFQACPVDVELSEGDEIIVGDLSFEVIDTPGHCRGHVSFLLSHGGKRVLFSGDLVFFGGKILLQNIPDCDLQAQIASLKKVRDLQVDMFFPGHLTFSLRNGQRHIDEALKIIDGLLIPPNFAYSW